MKENNSRREFLSQSGKMVTAAALFGTSVPLAHAAGLWHHKLRSEQHHENH
ncbi:deaminase [Escherichia coli]|nr:deaminase [Escherichia coli]